MSDMKILFVIICAAQVMASSCQSSSSGSLAQSPGPVAHGPFCKSYRRQQLVRRLNRAGGLKSRQGGYSPRYMAFTWQQVQRFTSLVTKTSSNSTNPSANLRAMTGLPLVAPSSAKSIVLKQSCQTKDNGLYRLCSACPAVTYLGPHVIPPFINEVLCEAPTPCNRNRGICKNTVMYQTFLMKTGRCDPTTGYETLEEFTQSIRVCCECLTFSPF